MAAVRGAIDFTPTWDDDYTGWPLGPKHRAHAVFSAFLNPTTGWPPVMPLPTAGYHKAIDILANDRTGPHPIFAVEGGTRAEDRSRLADDSPRRARSERRDPARALPLRARRAVGRGRPGRRRGRADRRDARRLVAHASRGARLVARPAHRPQSAPAGREARTACTRGASRRSGRCASMRSPTRTLRILARCRSIACREWWCRSRARLSSSR